MGATGTIGQFDKTKKKKNVLKPKLIKLILILNSGFPYPPPHGCLRSCLLVRKLILFADETTSGTLITGMAMNKIEVRESQKNL